MKVAFFSPYATVVPHFDTELDLAQQHLDAGDQVEFINCLGELPNCDANPTGDRARCRECIGRREMGIELLDHKRALPLVTQNFNRLHPHNSNAEAIDFDSLEQLIDYRIENFEIGFAVLSSLVSICRDPEPDIVQHRETVQRLLQSASHVFYATKDCLQRSQPDRVYVFNGRLASLRAVWRAAQAVGIDCFIHERGCDQQHYELFENHLPHEIGAVEKLIRNQWEQAADNPQRESTAAGWYRDRVNRVERNWHSFVKQQQPGALPENWNPQKHNVALYCSSDDEFVAIGDCWKNELYPNQVTAIARLAASLQDSAPHVQLTLRVHPNLRNVKNRRMDEMLSLNFPNLNIILPDSPIDSYELLRASDCVASFGSSVGMEAVFWERPSVLLGPSFYQNLGGIFRTDSHDEAVRLLANPLPVREKKGALQYGYWLQTHGHRHQYFTASGLFDGQFKGQTLYARPPKKTLAIRARNEAKRLLARLCH